MKISIVIPAYNEEGRILATISKIQEYTDKFYPDYEVVVVNDGSIDGTAQKIQEMMKDNKKISLIDNKINRGKGFAVKDGILKSIGDVILFMDADGSTPIESLSALLPFIDQGADVVISSRRIRGAKILDDQPIQRIFLGWIFRKITQSLTHLEIVDTQNGFKLFKAGAAKDIFSKVTIDGWAFDVEALVIANRFGYKCTEVPIVWRNDRRSKVSIISMIMMLMDLIKIGFRMSRGEYGGTRAKL